MKNLLLKLLLSTHLLLLISCTDTEQAPQSSPILLNLDFVPYYNDVDYWLSDTGLSETPLMPSDIQTQHFERFVEKWYLPWQAEHLQQQLTKIDFQTSVARDIKNYQNEVTYSNKCALNDNCLATALQINSRSYTPLWISAIAKNIPLAQFKNLNYQTENRAIITHNTMVRVLPTKDVYYRRSNKTNNVLPFDRLQTALLWVGMPVYILGSTHDQAWHFIYTPSYNGWVAAETVGRIDETTIDHWQSQPLMAIMQNKVSLMHDKSYLTQVGIGAVFPGEVKSNHHITIQFPIRSIKGQAEIISATLINDKKPKILPMPIEPTRTNFALILSEMVDKPYGWGGMHFYNDCSQELKNIYTPFGIWLARNSRMQMRDIKLDNLDDLKDETARIDFVREHARPFMTLAFIGGHIMMYVGEDENNTPVFYQNIWLMREKNTPNGQIIGQSLFLPIDVEQAEVYSLAHPKIRDHFWLGHLDQPNW